MSIFFAGRRERLLQLKAKREQASKGLNNKTTGAEIVCPECDSTAKNAALINNFMVCPVCNHHFAIGAYHRLSLILDSKSFTEIQPSLKVSKKANFPKYTEKLSALRSATGLKDSVITAQGKIGGYPVIVAVLDSRFLMGSMGSVMGEKIVFAVEKAKKLKLPLIIFSASGGARMQEGIVSLMQMAKTSAALEQFSLAGGLFISYLTHPTTGGVTASFASLGDIMLAEPNALIGFAGPRVIEQTIKQKLPKGFQSAEFAQEHGFVDKIVPRSEMKQTLVQLLMLHSKRR